ncbi:MAG: hypothetical protein AVDCRST_MAG38-224 [uncultured Solirubrobacteraceae bacterium]|uniref:Uncharacterized protein n=1 Tax=uncultured Solirubrobacteraceae bacterium TaxID=1162706 RepID=A0A6J4RAM5_9ACTN|nr:MAG: hypothetical protein AVDCRST_MAG38-224 [uncultured Solirubrobacteraceae bacterium]
MEDAGTARPLWVRMIAVLVLAAAAWILLKMVVGVLTTLAWIAAVVIAVLGVMWALSVLRR